MVRLLYLHTHHWSFVVVCADTITASKQTTHPAVQECFLHNWQTFGFFPFFSFFKSRSSESVIYQTTDANSGSSVQFSVRSRCWQKSIETRGGNFDSVQAEADEIYSLCKSHCAVLNEAASFWLILFSLSETEGRWSWEIQQLRQKLLSCWINPNHSYATLESEVQRLVCMLGLPPGRAVQWSPCPILARGPAAVPGWLYRNGRACARASSVELLCCVRNGPAVPMLPQNVYSLKSVLSDLFSCSWSKCIS